MVPIRDEDAIPVTSLPPVSPVNINVIYKHEGVYKRVRYNGMYEYQKVVDREFPYLGEPLEIADFTYDAVRMGTAPTISANGVMWMADKDENGNYISIAKLWRQECYVLFNGEKFYLSRIPTATKSNEDARYKYDIDFVSERVCLETVYLYDVVQPYVYSRPISESSVFSFHGDITELAKRINASLLKSGLASVALKKNGDVQVTPDSYLTYEEFNAVGLGTYTGPKDTSDPRPDVYDSTGQSLIHHVHDNVYEHYEGNYTFYLLDHVYVVNNPKTRHIGPASGGYDEIYDGEPVITGYQCVIGYDKKGVLTTSEEKLIPFEDNTIHEALQQVHDTYELQYYIYKERDNSGNFTGNTIIMIGDCEHDFADRNNADTDYVRDEDGLPTTQSPFDYGVDKALISKEKANSTEKIVTRITGKGSTENIPWYYPNPTADGWIKPAYNRLDTVLTDMGLTYPLSEGDDAVSSALYEKYIKNRIGNDFVYGKNVEVITNSSYRKDDPYNGWVEDEDTPNSVYGQFRYVIRARSQKGVNVPNPSIDMSFRIPSGVIKYYIKLQDNTANTYVEFDSTETYQNPNEFQKICAAGETTSNYQLTSGHIYYLIFNVWLNSIPNSKIYDFKGYLYLSHENWASNAYHIFHIRQDFYQEGSLTFGTVNYAPDIAHGEAYYPNIFDTNIYVQPDQHWCGYCKDNVAVEPIRRIVGQKYLNIAINPITMQPFNTVFKCIDDGKRALNAYEVAQMDIYEWMDTRFYLSLKLWSADSWYIKNKAVTLADYGLSITGSPVVKDTITFSRAKYITPCSNLMPSVYIKTDGERRFYNAHNYEPYQQGTPDTAIGEMNPSGSTNIINPLYQKEGSTSHYKFKNENIANRPKEHIENFEDVKPTITGQVNTVGNDTFRIDVVEMFAYDELDDNDVWENNDDGNVQGEYKHPYFFAKIRPLGFNIFDLALQEDMVLSMTTGHCGACNFKIGVDENTKKNPVQIWEYDVYEGENYNTKVFKYSAGELRRYVDTSNLYYDTTPGDSTGYIRVDKGNSNLVAVGFMTSVNASDRIFRDKTYTSDEVINGEVGSLKQNSKTHFEGDVVVKGKFIPSQQDTSTGYVWIALYKDIETYGTIMPYAKPDYGDGTYNHYIEPKGHYYINRNTGEEFVLTDTEADKFVFLNIRLPQVYLRTAEIFLSKKLIAYMYDNNYEKFNFSIKFSRVFMEENTDVKVLLNENSVLYVKFDDEIYRQYVKHYTYKVSKGESLPEITVDLNEELTYTNTKISQQQQGAKRRSVIDDDNRLNRLIRQSEARIERRCVSRTGDAVVEGNIIVRDASTSVVEINNNVDVAKGRIVTVNDNLDITKEELESAKEDISDNKEYLDDFVDAVNTFNDGASQRINQIKQTVEHRLPVASGGYIEHGCDAYKFNHNELTHKTELLWYNSDGTTEKVDDEMCYGDNTNMTSITWDEFAKR